MLHDYGLVHAIGDVSATISDGLRQRIAEQVIRLSNSG